MTPQPTFTGEVQFRRWSDSSTQGVQVTFALADSNELEPLKHKAGKRFMAVLVEIGDDEQPVQPVRKDTRGPLCKEACDYGKSPDFVLWLQEQGFTAAADEKDAKQWILNTCGVESRSELDTDQDAADAFIRRVRLPFLKWRRGQRQ